MKSINKSCAKEISVFLEYKFRLLKTIVSIPNKRLSHDVLTSLQDDFVAIIRNNDGSDETIYSVAEYQDLPCITFKFDTSVVYRAYLSIDELQSLIVSVVPEFENVIIIPDLNLKIFSSQTSDYSMTGIVSGSESGGNGGGGSNIFSASTDVGEFGYTVQTTVDAGVFYSELDEFRNKILLGNAILAILVLILAIVYSGQITTPIHKLIDAIQHIGGGNLEKRIDIQTNDEIQILANEFEIMRQRLYESYQGMEEKIQARTRELQEAQAQISHQEKMASLGLMAAGIAHEIGNPLTSISSLAQVIRRKTNDERVLEHINNILKGIERISRIVRELVDFSKPSAYKAAHTNINEIINSAVGIIKYDRRSKNITYELELDQTLPKTILVADHLLQVLLNILINAVDACEGYGNKIKVISYSKNGNIKIDITDEGCGIPQDKLNKIFEPFYTTKEVGKGTGLGLTVSYGLIKKMNGEIKVRSTLKKGSIFTVILPVKEETEE